MRWREVPEKIGEKEGRVGTADASSPAFDAARGRTHGTWSQGMCVWVLRNAHTGSTSARCPCIHIRMKACSRMLPGHSLARTCLPRTTDTQSGESHQTRTVRNTCDRALLGAPKSSLKEINQQPTPLALFHAARTLHSLSIHLSSPQPSPPTLHTNLSFRSFGFGFWREG
jgi:hypothetical protein